MKTTPLALAIAGVLAAAATGASAQTYGQAYGAYQQQQATYQQQQQAYATARARYEQDKASYDARYGYGAYERRYGVFNYAPDQSYGYGYGSTYPTTTYPAPSYPYSSSPYSSAPSTYGYGYGSPYGTSTPYGYGTPAPYNYGTPAPYSSNPYYAGTYGANSSYSPQPCSTSSSSGGVNIGVLAALAQAALGGGSSASSVLSQAVLGAGVDRSTGSSTVSGVKCDSRGPYYSYNQTQPYREGYYDSYGRWQATATARAYANCRIAAAPADTYGSQYRYVRVCPDSSGRYRITG
jgi:type II secretory pathway pseudopilin PulG